MKIGGAEESQRGKRVSPREFVPGIRCPLQVDIGMYAHEVSGAARYDYVIPIIGHRH